MVTFLLVLISINIFIFDYLIYKWIRFNQEAKTYFKEENFDSDFWDV